MNNIEKIKILIITSNNDRINDFIISKINNFFALDIKKINMNDLSEYIKTKIHLLIFDNVDIKEIKYSLLKNIENYNKHLHTAIVSMKLDQFKITKIYDKHIDYIFHGDYDDDYFISKFKNILKRKSSRYLLNSNIKFKNLIINQLEGEVYINEKLVDTTRKEYKIIKFLVKNHDNFISKNKIFQKVWKYDEDTTRVLDQYLHRIKKKIGNKIIIVSHRQKGIKIF